MHKKTYKLSIKAKRSVRAISPVIATLLMIAIAVAASLVAYAWIMGYIGNTTDTAGRSILVQSVAKDAAGEITVYVQNTGDSPVTLGSIYVDDTIVANPVFEGGNQIVNPGATKQIDLGAVALADPAGAKATIKVYTSTGTFFEYKKTFTGNSGPAGATPTPTPIPTVVYYKPIDIVDARVAGASHTDFPMLVTVSGDTDIGGKISGPNNVYFTLNDGTTLLSHEFESFSVAGGAASFVAWVKVPALTPTTVLRVCYGAGVARPAANNPTDVWDVNYKGIWHLGNGATLSALDSTSNNNDGTITEATATAGQMDGAGSFDGVNDKIDYGDINSLDGLTQLTVSAWIRPTDLAARDSQHFIAKRPADASTGWGFQSSGTGSSTNVLALIDGGSVALGSSTSNNIPLNAWTYVSFVYDGGQAGNSGRLKIYINGAAQTLTFSGTTIPASIAANSQTVTLGYSSDPNDKYWKGGIDEARTSIIARSATWITTEYNNMIHSTTPFYAILAQATL